MKMLAVVTYAFSYPMMQHHYINPQVLGLTPLVYHATYIVFFPFSIQSNSWAITNGVTHCRIKSWAKTQGYNMIIIKLYY